MCGTVNVIIGPKVKDGDEDNEDGEEPVCPSNLACASHGPGLGLSEGGDF